MLWKLSEISVSVPEIMDLTAVTGEELHEQLEQQAQAHANETLKPQYAELPNLVAVSPDGGRIMTRADAGRGVHQQAWKETKNACLLTMSSSTSSEDPHPELPTCFANRSYVEKLVREIHAAATGQTQECRENAENSEQNEEELDATSELPERDVSTVSKRPKWRPQRLVRTCVSSMACSDEFGPLVAGEAQRRGFYQAARRAFLGDGQAWNWTLHEQHFPDFTAITDFVHPLGYVYDAAKALTPADPWPTFLDGAKACWQGRVVDFLNELRAWQASHPNQPDEKLSADDPRVVVQRAVTYLDNNRERMNYPAYRREGLPVSTAMIESLIKEVNYRVKGTEKFWNRPQGAENILQVVAANLCDDDRLSQWILNRPGSYFHRPSTLKKHPLLFPRLMRNLHEGINQFQQRPQMRNVQNRWKFFQITPRRWFAAIGPSQGDSKAATRSSFQDQSWFTGYAPSLEDWELLSSKRMIGMRDGCRSQSRAAIMCSSRRPSLPFAIGSFCRLCVS